MSDEERQDVLRREALRRRTRGGDSDDWINLLETCLDKIADDPLGCQGDLPISCQDPLTACHVCLARWAIGDPRWAGPKDVE